MAKLSILAGATSQSINIFIQDTSKTNGAGLTGLVFNSPSLIGYYTFAGANATAVAITLATLAAVNSAFSSGGFKEIDATHMPGVYRLDIPNTALAAASGRSVLIMLSGAANMAPTLIEIALTAVDDQSTAFGLVLAKTTNITGFNDIAATAVVSAGAINTASGAVSSVTTVATTTNLTNAPTAGDFTATMKTSLNASTPASIQGAVASVTGNVGGSVASVVGNVGGSVASVVGSIGGDLVGHVGGSVFGNVNGSVASVVNPVTVGTNNDKNGYALTAAYDAAKTAAQAGDAMALTPTERTAVAGIITSTVMTEDYPVKGDPITPAQGIYFMLQQYAEMSLSGTTQNVKGRDQSTIVKTLSVTLDGGGEPIAVSEAT